MGIIVVENEEELVKNLAKLIEKVSKQVIEGNGIFKIGVSGGSLIKYLVKGLPCVTTDYSKWQVFFCDERVVLETDSESTFGAYKRELIGKVGLNEDQFVKIKQGVSAEEAAADYTVQMQQYFPQSSFPNFDMLLLGMGPDGHTCSLFPGHKLLEEKSLWVAPITDSPKPPSSRITLTYPVINNASYCVFAASGEGKADMVKRIVADKEDLPAKRVNPTSGNLYWILDKGAAKLIL